jgi:hypothetical protein
MGGLGRPVAPVVGSPTVARPTRSGMPNLVVLWEMSPLRRGVRAGARLWARSPARRRWDATAGPKPKPGGAGEAPGPLRGEARRPAQGYFLKMRVARRSRPTRRSFVYRAMFLQADDFRSDTSVASSRIHFIA